MKKIAALAVVFCLLLVACSPAASEPPPLAYEPEEYEEYIPEQPEPLLEISLPEESEDEEKPVDEEYEPVTAPVTHAAQAGQIIIGHHLPSDDGYCYFIHWDDVITDPGDIALIEGFLRGRYRKTAPADAPPLLSGRPPHMNLVLDGVPMSFGARSCRFPGMADRVLFFDDASGWSYSVDWRIWQVLVRYGDFHEWTILTALPPVPLPHPETEHFTMGQIFEQNGVQLTALRRIHVERMGAAREYAVLVVTDPAQMQAIVTALGNVRLTTAEGPHQLDWHNPVGVYRMSLFADDFRVSLVIIGQGTMQYFPNYPAYPTTIAFYGPEGAILHALLGDLFGG